jgi:hypothetical protein
VLTCTICGLRPYFIKVRLELPHGAATYLICTNPPCIEQAMDRTRDNVRRAAVNVGGRVDHGDVIDAKVVDVAAIEPP